MARETTNGKGQKFEKRLMEKTEMVANAKSPILTLSDSVRGFFSVAWTNHYEY